MTRNEYLTEVVQARVKHNESYRELPYQLKYDDTTGKTIRERFKTVGYGHRIIPGETLPTDKNGFEALFASDFDRAVKGADTYDLPPNTPHECYGVVVEMAYQMGTDGVRKFKNTLDYMRMGDYENASVEMLDSKWATQTPHRAVELSNIVKGCAL